MKGPAKKKKPISEKQRESDEKLREELRNFDLKKFDKALDNAINPNTFKVLMCFLPSYEIRQGGGSGPPWGVGGSHSAVDNAELNCIRGRFILVSGCSRYINRRQQKENVRLD